MLNKLALSQEFSNFHVFPVVVLTSYSDNLQLVFNATKQSFAQLIKRFRAIRNSMAIHFEEKSLDLFAKNNA